MGDRFSGYSDAVTAPSRRFTTVTPDDNADLAEIPKALYVGTGGDVKVIGVDAPASASGVTFKNVAGGSVLDIRPRRVLATGTSAADIVAFL